MDNRYAAPQLLAMMTTAWNIRGHMQRKLKGFASDKLTMNNDTKRGSYGRLVNRRLGMVIIRWKDSRILQTVSTIMKPGIKTIGRQVVSEMIDVRYVSDNVEYQMYMDGVDREDQHKVMGDGFANVAHF